MKKLITTAFVLLVATVLFSACKTHERCPAYGSTEVAVEVNDKV